MEVKNNITGNRMKLFFVVIITFFSFSVSAQRAMTNLNETYYFSTYLQCNMHTGKCFNSRKYKTKVQFIIDSNGAGLIYIDGPDSIGSEIEYNNIEYSDNGKGVTFYTTRGNKIRWFINSNNESESISLILPNNMSYSFTNR